MHQARLPARTPRRRRRPPQPPSHCLVRPHPVCGPPTCSAPDGPRPPAIPPLRTHGPRIAEGARRRDEWRQRHRRMTLSRGAPRTAFRGPRPPLSRKWSMSRLSHQRPDASPAVSASGDEKIDAWVEEQLALSPAWSAAKLASISALLGTGSQDNRIERTCMNSPTLPITTESGTD
ncbi:protein of unknown function [Streptantibioticus cattleyicolor NRRL 8057 = DSM 46488]|nr:protein of unknown function [Streptantibioticus cattleyicolor NRRL 8057 = DSM 46488]